MAAPSKAIKKLRGTRNNVIQFYESYGEEGHSFCNKVQLPEYLTTSAILTFTPGSLILESRAGVEHYIKGFFLHCKQDIP